MKFLILILIFFLSCEDASTPKKTVLKSDTKNKNGVVLFQNKPFSGIVKIEKSSRSMYTETEYLNGKKHGLEVKLYEDSSYYWKRSYIHGEKSGTHSAWWPNHKIKFIFQFKNGEFHGEQKEWYKSGKLLRNQNYLEGKEEGLQQSWRENGKLRANYIVKNGRTYGVVKARLCYNVKDGKGKF